MSNHTFVKKILELRNASLEEFIERLYALFSAISQMNDKSVVAAYQTLRTVAEESGFTEDLVMKRVASALLLRMQAIIGESTFEDNVDTEGLMRYFWTATGFEFDAAPAGRSDIREPFKLTNSGSAKTA